MEKISELGNNLQESVKINVEKIVLKHINDKSVNPHNVNPIYLKLTEAEEKLNDKNLIVISVNEKGKYSQIITEAFYKQVK